MMKGLAKAVGGGRVALFRSGASRVIPLLEGSVIVDSEGIAGGAIDAARGASSKPFLSVSTTPRLPAMIPDEILEYFGWVFRQRGFLNLHMTFEQFLAVIAAVNPTALRPGYDASDAGATFR